MIGPGGPPLLELRARATPQAPALRDEEAGLTFAELDRSARSAAAALLEAGARAGERVAILARRGSDLARWLHAADRVGVTLAPLHLRLATRELALQLRQGAFRLIVADSERAEQAASLGEELGIGCLEASAAAPAPSRWPARGRAPLLLVHTSGTEGRARGALLGREALLAGAVASALHLGVVPGDGWYACLPLYHVGGLAILVRSALYGIPVLTRSRFDPEDLDRAVEGGEATLLSLVAPMLERWLELRPHRAPDGLRAVLIGGGPCPEPLLRRGVELGLPLAPTYGLTEASSQVATRSPAERRPPYGGRLRPLLGTEVRIVGPAGERLPPGTAGEIQVRGPTLMRGYHGLPEETARALRGGWLHTRDVGILDDEGGLRVLGRLDDVIVSGGENVAPAEIEAVLAEHPAVREVAVVGHPDPHFGERPVAYLVATGPLPGSEVLRAFCRARLAGHKVPVAFHRVEALPRNALGKLLRRELRSAGEPRAPSSGGGSGRDASPSAP